MPDQAEYPLRRNRDAACRLNLQHYFLTQHLDGHLLDPKIAQDSTDLVVGDVCCGSGIWLMSLANQLPQSSQLHAFDVSFDQFPHPSLRPKNLTCHSYNVFDEPPEDLKDKFDVINVSLTVTFITDNMIEAVIAKVAKFLKLGGYLQWQEIDTASTICPHPNPDVPPRFVNQCVPLCWECAKATPPKWIARLEAKMEAVGLYVVSSARPDPDPKLLSISTQLVLMGLDEFSEGMKTKEATLDTQTKENLANLETITLEAWGEHQQTGNSISLPLVRVVGQRTR